MVRHRAELNRLTAPLNLGKVGMGACCVAKLFADDAG